MTVSQERRSYKAARPRACGLALGALAFAWGLSPAQARVEPAASIRSLGMSDSVQAHETGNGAIFHNPAGISRTLAYSIESGYYTQAKNDVDSFHLSVADTKTNRNVGVGVAYTFLNQETPERLKKEIHGGRLALSREALPETMWVGAGLRYLNIKRDVLDDNFHEFTLSESAFTMDLGMQLQAAEGFMIGLAGHNIINVGSSEAPTRLGLGLAYTWEGLTVSADSVIDITSVRGKKKMLYMGGAEYLLGYQLAIRTGVQRDDVDGLTRVSTGLGWLERTYAIEAGFYQSTTQEDDRLFGIALKIFM